MIARDTRPLVSVVIPVFNGANYLTQAIESVLQQTWQAIEILVVDDGSNDGGATHAIIERYRSRIRAFSKPNGGVGSALNFAIAHMNGSFFTWLSHDDFFRHDKIERQIRALTEIDGTTIVFSDTETIDAQGHPIARHYFGGEDFVKYPLWAVFEGRISGCTLLIPRLCFTESGTFLEALPTTQDYELWFRFALKYPFLHVPEPLVQQRSHPKQASRHSRHLDEASLLWMDMLDRTPSTVMQSYCGSDRAFIERVLRFLKSGPYFAAVAGVEQLLRDLDIRRGGEK